MKRCVGPSSVLLVLLAGAWAQGHAAELVVGGYSDQAPPPSAPAALPSAALPSGAAPAVVLGFTPRAPSALTPIDGEGEDLPRPRFELALGGSPAERFEGLGAGPQGQPSWRTDPGESVAGLTVGGAVRWSDWSLGGAYERADLFGGPANLVSANLGYGALTASLAYGQASRVDQPPLDVLMFSTDLAALSWLRVESDLALGSAADEAQSVAVGRLGVRLNF